MPTYIVTSTCRGVGIETVRQVITSSSPYAAESAARVDLEDQGYTDVIVQDIEVQPARKRERAHARP